jgi:hypothetical protein
MGERSSSPSTAIAARADDPEGVRLYGRSIIDRRRVT